MQTPAVRTGVYLNHNRNSAILVKVSEGTVWYLTALDCAVDVYSASAEKFLREFRVYLPDYPVLRAAKLYASSTFQRSERAEKILHILLKRARSAEEDT